MPNGCKPFERPVALYPERPSSMRAAKKLRKRGRYWRIQIEALQPRLFMSVTPTGLERIVKARINSAITMPALAMNPAPDLGAGPDGGNDPVATPAGVLPDIPPTVATPAAASPSVVTGTTAELSVLGADVLGEAILKYQWTATVKPAGSNPQFSINGTNAAKNDTVTFDQPGTYTFNCTITGAHGHTVNSAVNVTVDQTLSSVAIQPGPPAMADRTSYPFTAIAKDQFGGPMSVQPVFNWSVGDGGAEGTIDSAGVYSAPENRTGVDTILASCGDLSAMAVVTITDDGIFNGGAQIGTPAIDGYFSDSAGTYTVTGAGANGGASDQVELPYQALAGDAVMVANLDSVGGTSTDAMAGIEFRESLSPASAYLAITRNGGSGSDEIGLEIRTASGGIASSLNLISAAGADWLKLVRSGNQFTAYYGSNGIIWTQLGSTITLGIGNAMLGGLVVSSNSAASVSEGTFSDVSIGAAVDLSTPASVNPNPVTTTTAHLSVLGGGQFGESGLTYTWTSAAQPGTNQPDFSSNGTNAAKNTTVTFNQAGEFTLTCTISDGSGDAVTSSVNVTVLQVITKLALSPASPTVLEGATQQFSAMAADQFGNPMPTPAVVWAVSSGGGSISNSGLYTAAGTSGTSTVSIYGAGLSADAHITIPNQPPTVIIAADASPNVVTGSSTELSVLAADDGGESHLTYTWSTIGTPPAPVMFLLNGTNAAKNDTAMFTAPGAYDLLVTITDANGATATSSVKVNVYRVAHTPAVTDASTLLNTPTSSGLVITPNPLDGPAQGYYQIANISGGMLFQHDGATPITSGQFITFAQGLAGLVFNPAFNSKAAGSFTVQAASSPSIAGLVASQVTAAIAVEVPARTPTVTNAVSVEYQMTVTGLVIRPDPADAGEPIEFRITDITGGSLFQSDGLTPIGAGDFITAAQGLAGLKFKPDVQTELPCGFDVQASLTPTIPGLGGNVVAATVSVIPPSAPSIASPANRTVFQGRSLVFSSASGNAITISNADGGIQTLSLSTSNGTLTLPTAYRIALNSLTAANKSNIYLVGRPSAINAALDGLTFRPNAGYIGSATVQITGTDAQSIVLGSPLSSAVAVAVTVAAAAAPAAPVASHPPDLGGNSISLVSQIQGLQLTTTANPSAGPVSQIAPTPVFDRVASVNPRVAVAAIPEAKSEAAAPAPTTVATPPPVVETAPPIATSPMLPAPIGVAEKVWKKTPLPLRANRQFLRDLDVMLQQAGLEHQRFRRILAGTATLAAAAMSLMHLVRAIRARSILKTVASSMHAWKLEDPFSMLDPASPAHDAEVGENDQHGPIPMVQPQRRRAA